MDFGKVHVKYLNLYLIVIFLASGFTSQPKAPQSSPKPYRFRSEVPAPPTNTGVGGKASMLPKRTPVSDKEIEAILVCEVSFYKFVEA